MDINKTKKSVYIILFTIFGILLSFLAHAEIEMWYINLLLSDFKKYSFGFSWPELYFIHHIGTLVLFAIGAWFGFRQGRYWWKILYVKKLRRKWKFFQSQNA